MKRHFSDTWQRSGHRFCEACAPNLGREGRRGRNPKKRSRASAAAKGQNVLFGIWRLRQAGGKGGSRGGSDTDSASDWGGALRSRHTAMSAS